MPRRYSGLIISIVLGGIKWVGNGELSSRKLRSTKGLLLLIVDLLSLVAFLSSDAFQKRTLS